MKLLLFSCLLFPLISLAQKDQKLFKADQSWEDAYAVKEKSAPADVQQKLVQLRQKGSKEGWTFQVGYTSVINKDIRRITGLVIPSEKEIKANPKLYEPDPGYSKMQPEPTIIPAQCVASARRFDAREHGWVTPVRDQADCGSCWAFGAVAAFETSFLMKNGGNASMLDLSEQQVVNCTEHTAWGCWNGGMTSAGVGYITDHHLQTESGYPYTGRDVDCRPPGTTIYRGRRWGWVGGTIFSATGASMQDIKQAICSNGSVLSGVYAGPAFQAYRSGVMNEVTENTVITTNDYSPRTNHVVQIIGWDDDKQAWLIKNSWGEGWGFGGFAWVRYNTNHIGGYSCWIEASSVSSRPSMPVVLAPIVNTGFNYERDLPANVVYEMQNVRTGKMVEVEDGCGVSKGTKVQQYDNYESKICVDGKNQQWLFIPAGESNGNRLFYIFNYGFRKYMEAGVRVTVQKGTDADLQRWIIQPSSEEGVFYIRSVSTNKYLEVPNNSTADGEWMGIADFTGAPNQKFKFTKYVGLLGPQGYSYGSYVNIATTMNENKVINVPYASLTNGTAIQIYDLVTTSLNEQWQLVRTPDGYYRLKPRLSDPNKCADLENPEGYSGTAVVSSACMDVLEKQKWLVVPCVREPGSYILFNKASGRCLDLSGANTSNFTPISLYYFVDAANQKWRFRPVR